MTAARWPRVAVLGRQNVGKSTLVNRLLGRREAIADELPGVTRDRVEARVEVDGRSFVVVDTGGFVGKARGLEQAVVRQAERAAAQADLSLLVVDVTTGITAEDEALAARLRRSGRPALVVANKVDSERQEPLAAEFHALGLGEPLPVSALHGRGVGELVDRILDLIPISSQAEEEPEPRFCLLGRPNVGKSSLFNRLLGEERAVVHEEPGTTRDAVDSVVEVGGRVVRFVDTAGLRRVVKTRGVEYYGVLRSLRALERSHVALLVVDASEGLTREDRRIAGQVVEAGRGLVVALNKWDLVPRGERDERFRALSQAAAPFPGTPVLRTSALSGVGVHRVVPALLAVHEAWSRRVPTAAVNRVLERATAAHPPPRGVGRILYGTQVGAGPPTFVLFGAREPDPSYRRYLEHALREAFGFEGAPLRLVFRPRERHGERRRSGARAR
ncbi:MAG TPA: ribosome biogenesis GTPase Der [Actinomycetota bacterium]|nr:ribosome biogenesis GTPase Der [Actinomycetota bacterium]